MIFPTANIPIATIQLGHFAEEAGEHYLCVQESFHSNKEAMEYVSQVRYENREFSSHDENSNDNLNRSEHQITEERHEPRENEDGDISKNQEDSGAELQNNDVRIRFEITL